MSKGIDSLFQDRFHGHESPVDPGVWTGIQQQMAMAAPAADGIEELFKERFQSHESAVDPSVWQGISSQLGHGVAVGTSTSILGWAAAGAVAVVIGAAGFFLLKDTEPTPSEDRIQPVTEIATPKPSSSAEFSEHDVASKPNVSALVGSSEKIVQTTSLPERKSATSVDRIDDRPSNNSSSIANSGSQATAMETRPSSAPMKTPLDLVPVNPSKTVDAPAKVENIIRELTDEVQMEVLSKPEERVVEQPIDPNGPGSQETMRPMEVNTAPLPKLFMANTFTPNGDGVNDAYSISREGYRSMMVRVYSMKNDQLVFSTNNGEAWTGNNCEDGMYMVAVEAVTEDGRTVTEGKVVWLTRVRLN